MKHQMLDNICCPVCKEALSLKAEKENDVEILAGFLTCKKCKFDYLIQEGIPNLLPPELQKTM
ncbi:MAG: methytransferase partner Trm112 [Candidatus Thermoplasmatota archaeon]|nr:Trm112 family protein [Euryarchaeota archaeon]MBU4031526.1 methytransferase partner Trm112 [Candidatus Thermoplasmatota archaeon]MBU4072001.1 methytransferase partner Trm112 [Candidatus Thermoplasmatota archaeon]MBU4144532.1 methytransferase partner Trm112 [Candidatus Thermoplasmatota archaeon]MBU4592081.1 methytransferase partner Trm112 [Candidatus Thermoplasmatota archaeon]